MRVHAGALTADGAFVRSQAAIASVAASNTPIVRVRVESRYSFLSATTGSTREARRAGM